MHASVCSSFLLKTRQKREWPFISQSLCRLKTYWPIYIHARTLPVYGDDDCTTKWRRFRIRRQNLKRPMIRWNWSSFIHVDFVNLRSKISFYCVTREPNDMSNQRETLRIRTSLWNSAYNLQKELLKFSLAKRSHWKIKKIEWTTVGMIVDASAFSACKLHCCSTIGPMII